MFFSTAGDLFGVSESLADESFNNLVRLLVAKLYDTYVKMSSTGAEWETGIQGFIEKYKLTCVGSWDKFYVYVLFKSKQFYNFKKRNTMTNLALVEYNKGILYAAVGVPGSTHDGRMLKSTNLPRDI